MKSNLNNDFLSRSYNETINFGNSIGKSLCGGEILLLKGELGSGKTCLTKGIAEGLDIKDNITSPSFTIMNIYDGTSLKLFHLDLYRIETVNDFMNIELDEYLSPNAVLVIEWGEKFLKYIPKPFTIIEIKILSEIERLICMEQSGLHINI